MSDPSPSDPSPVVVIADPIDSVAQGWLAERCRVRLPAVPSTAPGARSALRAALADAEGLIVRTVTGVDADLLAAAPRLRVIGRAGVGLDHIAVRVCRERGVEVVHTPDANSSAVVEFVLALVCDAMRPRVFLDSAIDPGRWEEVRRELTADAEINERTVGVYGCGRIGTRIARTFLALGCRVLVHDLRRVSQEDLTAMPGVEVVDRETLLGQSDILTLHVDGRPANRGLIGESAFALMREGVLLLNTSRGLVVDHGLLAEFLGVNPRAQAILDVHELEPIPADGLLWSLPNAHLSPHLASCTASAKARMSWVVRDVWRVLSGEAPEHPAPFD